MTDYTFRVPGSIGALVAEINAAVEALQDEKADLDPSVIADQLIGIRNKLCMLTERTTLPKKDSTSTDILESLLADVRRHWDMIVPNDGGMREYVQGVLEKLLVRMRAGSSVAKVGRVG